MHELCEKQELGWIIEGRFNLDDFFEAISEIVPVDAILYLEGTSMGEDVLSVVSAMPAVSENERYKVERGTEWPEPKCFHLRIGTAQLDSLAALAKTHAVAEICDHVVVYRGNRPLVRAYDIGHRKARILVSQSIDEKQVEKFARRTGASHRQA